MVVLITEANKNDEEQQCVVTLNPVQTAAIHKVLSGMNCVAKPLENSLFLCVIPGELATAVPVDDLAYLQDAVADLKCLRVRNYELFFCQPVFRRSNLRIKVP